MVSVFNRGLGFVLTAMLLVWMGSLLGLFDAADGLLYDRLVQLPIFEKNEEIHVLMVEVDNEGELAHPDHWLQLLDKLMQLGSSQIVFTYFPKTADARFYHKARQLGRVWFGRTLDRRNFDVDGIYLTDLPPEVGFEPLPYGVVTLPPADVGIYRRARVRVTVAGQTLPTLEAAAAGGLGVAVETLPDAPFLINFNHGRDWLPRVGVTRVLENGLIPELVVGRSVVIGPEAAPARTGLHTPINHDGDTMPWHEFQAYALASLLVESTIHNVNLVWLAGLLLIVTVLNLFVCQWMSALSVGRFTGGMIIAYLFTAWLMLHFQYLWIPVVELITIQILSSVLISRYKLNQSEHALRKMVLDSMSRFHERLRPNYFYDSPEYMSHVVRMVDQSLNLSRLIFMEKVPGDHRVREIKALNCSLEDIHERRRDYERTPYSTAIAERRPIVLEYEYLKDNGDTNELQYLVPLIFAGEIQGFWAFGVAQEVVENTDHYLNTVHVFSNQIAELLFHRNRWRDQMNVEGGLLRRFLSLNGGRVISSEVRECLGVLHRRASTMEMLINGMDTGTMVYDLFGQVMHINMRMEEFMRVIDLPCYELSALDVLAGLTNVSAAKGREILQQTVLQREEFHLPLAVSGQQAENFMLSLRPLACDEGGCSVMGSVMPFELLGILFELVDVTELSKAYGYKDLLYERLGSLLRNDMEAIVLGSEIIGNESVDADKRHRAAAIIHEKAENAIDVFHKTQRYVLEDVSREDAGMHPVGATMPVTMAVKALTQKAQQRSIQFETHTPPFTTLVRAQLKGFERLMYSLLEVLLNDAAEDTVIDINVKRQDGWIIYRLRNAGFGVPNDKLQNYLFAQDGVVAEEFRKLRNALRFIPTWDGEVDVSSEVGVGMSITLKLREAV